MCQEFAPVQGSEAVGRMNHAESFFAAAAQICRDISFGSIEALASELDRTTLLAAQLPYAIAMGVEAELLQTFARFDVAMPPWWPVREPVARAAKKLARSLQHSCVFPA